MARMWLTSHPLVRPIEDVPKDILAAEVDMERMEHLRILDERLVGGGKLGEDLPAGPLVDKMVDAGNKKERRSRKRPGYPPGPRLDGKESGEQLQAGDTELVRVRVHDRGVLRVAGGHLRCERQGDHGLGIERQQTELGIGAQRELHAVLERWRAEDDAGEDARIA